MPTELAAIDLLRIGMMIVAAALAVLTDVRERRIPNRLTAPLAVAGVALGLVSGGLGGFALAVAGGLAGGLLFVLPVAKFGWGMGDLKLAAALGTMGGPLFAIWMGLYALAAGGLFALLWLKHQGLVMQVASGIQGDLRAGRAPTARSGLAIPFAVPIAVGMLMALLISPGLPR